MTKLDAARARVAVVVKQLEDHSPYLDYKDGKKHGPIARGLLDGRVSLQSQRAVERLPAVAARAAANAEARAHDVEGLKREVAMRNVDQDQHSRRTDISDVWILYRPDLLTAAIPKVTPKEIADLAEYTQRKADWYRSGEKLATELVSAVNAQVEAQPRSMTWLETARDALKIDLG